MKSFSGDTDSMHEQVIASELRAYFSATAARVKDQVWLRVEARWIADDTPLAVEIFREDDDTGRETVQKFDGTLGGGVWEPQWTIDLPKSRLDELYGPIDRSFEAQPDGHPAPALSQTMLVHRTRYSS